MNLQLNNQHRQIKYIAIILILMITPLLTHAQSILGVKVGESYTEAKRMLRARYGDKLSESNGNLALYDFEMGDFFLKYGTLYFQWDIGIARFYKATFQTWATVKDVEELKRKREYLKSKLESKYRIFEFKNEQGFRCYEFLGYETNGVTMRGSIELERSKGNDGIERLYLFLYYFPIAAFINENTDF